MKKKLIMVALVASIAVDVSAEAARVCYIVNIPPWSSHRGCVWETLHNALGRAPIQGEISLFMKENRLKNPKRVPPGQYCLPEPLGSQAALYQLMRSLLDAPEGEPPPIKRGEKESGGLAFWPFVFLLPLFGIWRKRRRIRWILKHRRFRPLPYGAASRSESFQAVRVWVPDNVIQIAKTGFERGSRKKAPLITSCWRAGKGVLHKRHLPPRQLRPLGLKKI